MNSEKLNKILELHKKWLNNERDGVRADLRDANLRDADLRDANLRDADLRDADLRDADLNNANLRFANLNSADLRFAKLNNANLRNVDLTNADLDYSCLPLCCGSLLANMDDRQVKQLLYHTLSIVKHSNNVSELLKEELLTEENIKIAKEFHRAEECKKL